MNPSRVLLMQLSQRTSAKGNAYLSGWLGKASVVAFAGEPDKHGNPTWDLFVSTPEPRPEAKSNKRLIPLAPADQHLVGGGLEGEAEPEETVEGGDGIVPAVEPEHELVEVGLEVRRPQPVVDAQGPPLRVRE